MTGAVPAGLKFGPEGPGVEWLPTDGLPFAEPFFEQTLLRLRRALGNFGRPGIVTPAAELGEAPESAAPTSLIFHVSRCGSTLVAQMLAALPRSVVVSEAPIIDDILLAPRRDPSVTDDDRIAWLRGAVRALAQTGSPEVGRVFVKLDSWHIFELPILRRAFPGVPMIFVHRHPVEVLVSLMRMTSWTLVRGIVAPEQLGISAEERDTLSPEEHAAAILGAFFRSALQHRDELIPVAYEALPDFVWESMPGCIFTPAERTALQSAARFNAKAPGAPFESDAARKRSEARPAVLAASKRWAEPDYLRWSALSPTR